jgi:hypothetical protein
LGWLTYAREYNSRKKGSFKHYHPHHPWPQDRDGIITQALQDHAVQLWAMSIGLSSNFLSHGTSLQIVFLVSFLSCYHIPMRRQIMSQFFFPLQLMRMSEDSPLSSANLEVTWPDEWYGTFQAAYTQECSYLCLLHDSC